MRPRHRVTLGARQTAVRIACTVAVVAAAWAIPTAAAELSAGAVVRAEFPELPDTLCTMAGGQRGVPQMTIRLPRNYDKSRPFPAFVWLWGGHGGDGSGPGAGPDIAGDRDYVFVGMPLFKAAVDPAKPFKGLAIDPTADAAVIARAFGAMLRRLDATIPNVDRSRGVIGGVSNGAHTVATILELDDASLADRFEHVVFVEGGFWLRRADRLAGRRLLLVHGDQGGPERALINRDAARLLEKARANQADATTLVMEGVGHDFPRRFMPSIKEWLDDAPRTVAVDRKRPR